MIRREVKSGKVRITFVLPQDEPPGRVSVLGDFNDWTSGVHTMARRSNGTRSVAVTVTPGAAYAFRYRTEDGHWFDEPDADDRDGENGVILA